MTCDRGTVQYNYVAARILWNMLHFSVKSVSPITQYRSHLKTYLRNLTYPPYIPGYLMKIEIVFIGSETGQHQRLIPPTE